MTLSSRFVRSSVVKTRCSTPGGRPPVSGRIQIWMNRIGSSFEAFSSECSAPEPRVMRWTDPAGSGPNGPPTLSSWPNVPSTT